VLVQAIGWEAIFFVNVPIGIGALALTVMRVQESSDPSQGRLDWPGTVTFSLALFFLIFGLIRGNPEGWNGAIIACLVAAAVLLIAFVVIELRSPHPMLDLHLFRNPTFDGASIAAFVLSASMFAMFLYLTLYIQNILGYTALQSGLRFIAVTLVSFVVAPISGKLAERLGARWFMGGGLLLVGVGLMLMHGIQPGDSWTGLLPGFIVCGAGIGAVNPALATAAIGVVEPRRAGMASGINSTFRQVGIATGIAAWGALFQHKVASEFTAEAAQAHLRGRPPGGGSVADFIAFGGPQQTHNAALIRAAETAFDAGLNHILVIAAVVAFAGAVLTVVLVRPVDFATARAPAQASGQTA